MDKQGFLGVYEIPVTSLIEPKEELEEYKVREVQDVRVDSLFKAFLEAEDIRTFLSTFVVMAVQGTEDNVCYMVIDGNHRLAALKKYESEMGEKLVSTVHCFVYNGMKPDEALGLGYQRNEQNVLKMSDFDKVVTIRKILKLQPDQEGKRKSNAPIYKCLNISDNKLTGILNVSIFLLFFVHVRFRVL